jgi:hypothetical protein
MMSWLPQLDMSFLMDYEGKNTPGCLERSLLICDVLLNHESVCM